MEASTIQSSNPELAEAYVLMVHAVAAIRFKNIDYYVLLLTTICALGQ